MVKEAEANKAEDEKKRKDIETRNKAEQMINEIDKALAEQGDKIDANQKQQAEQLKTELKTALDNNDMATLEAKMSELKQTLMVVLDKQHQITMMIMLLMLISKKRTNYLKNQGSSLVF